MPAPPPSSAPGKVAPPGEGWRLTSAGRWAVLAVLLAGLSTAMALGWWLGRQGLAEPPAGAAAPGVVQRQGLAARPESVVTSEPLAMPPLPWAELRAALAPVASAAPTARAAGVGPTARHRGPWQWTLWGLPPQTSRKIVVAVDISGPVVRKVVEAGGEFREVRTAVEEWLQHLEGQPGVEFGLLLFAQNCTWYTEGLRPATPTEVAAARLWLRKNFREDGRSGTGWQRDTPNGIQAVLTRALAWAPEAVVVFSDGDFQRRPPQGGVQRVPWAELAGTVQGAQAGRVPPTALYFIGYGMLEAHLAELRQLAGRTGGRAQPASRPAPPP